MKGVCEKGCFIGEVICFGIVLICADFRRLRTLPGYQKETLIMSLEILLTAAVVARIIVYLSRELREWYRVLNERG